MKCPMEMATVQMPNRNGFIRDPLLIFGNPRQLSSRVQPHQCDRWRSESGAGSLGLRS